jgi:hypothetical protein
MADCVGLHRHAIHASTAFSQGLGKAMIPSCGAATYLRYVIVCIADTLAKVLHTYVG